MKLYADTSSRRLGQLVGDLTALAWSIVAVLVVRSVYGRVLELSGPGRQLEVAGDGLHDKATHAQGQVADLPGIGGAISKPLKAIGDMGRSTAAVGRSEQEAARDVALLLAVVVATTLFSLVVVWVVRRLRWARKASQARNLAMMAGGRSVLALRALANAPIAKLRRVAPDPVEAWRSGDPDAERSLADVELATLGLRTHTDRKAGVGSPV